MEKQKESEQELDDMLNRFVNNEIIGVPMIADDLYRYAKTHDISLERNTIEHLITGLVDLGYVVESRTDHDERLEELKRKEEAKNAEKVDPVVFISYSRKDIEKARQIKMEIEQQTGCQCWMDMEGIESGAQFEEVIIDALNRCRVIVFVLSVNSMHSVYAQKEVRYAYSKHKKLIPVQIDDAELTDWFLFNFCGVDIISYNRPEQQNKLFANLMAWGADTASGAEANDGQADRYSQGGRYDILQNAAGEILLIIDAFPTPPVNPRLVYDGGKCMLYYHSRKHAKLLDDISEEAREALINVEKVFVVEVKDDDVLRSNDVLLRKIHNLDDIS